MPMWHSAVLGRLGCYHVMFQKSDTNIKRGTIVILLHHDCPYIISYLNARYFVFSAMATGVTTSPSTAAGSDCGAQHLRGQSPVTVRQQRKYSQCSCSRTNSQIQFVKFLVSEVFRLLFVLTRDWFHLSARPWTRLGRKCSQWRCNVFCRYFRYIYRLLHNTNV